MTNCEDPVDHATFRAKVSPIVVQPAILRLVGPVPAVVYAILSAGDSGDGVELAYCQIADAACISPSSARRAVAKLRQEGLILSEPAVEELYGQRGNRYRVPAQGQNPVQFEQPCMVTNILKRKDSQLDKASNHQVTNSIDYQCLTDLQGNLPAPPEVGVDPTWPISWCLLRAWTPPNSPMPFPANHNLLQSCREALWLVSYAERYILDRQNQERERRGWRQLDGLPEKRRLQFLRDAEKLLRDHELSSIAEVIDWVFLNHAGWLPFDVIDSIGMTRKDSERKVTSLRKIWENYDTILSVRCIDQV